MGALVDGMAVSYVGEPEDGLDVGDRGKVLMVAGSASHVMWTTGARLDQVDLVDNRDLVVGVLEERSVWDDALDGARLTRFSARDVFSHRGAGGVISRLHAEGHLANMTPIVSEAIQGVAARLRQDPSVREVVAQLGEDGEQVIATLTAVLLRQAVQACPNP